MREEFLGAGGSEQRRCCRYGHCFLSAVGKFLDCSDVRTIEELGAPVSDRDTSSTTLNVAQKTFPELGPDPHSNLQLVKVTYRGNYGPRDMQQQCGRGGMWHRA